VSTEQFDNGQQPPYGQPAPYGEQQSWAAQPAASDPYAQQPPAYGAPAGYPAYGYGQPPFPGQAQPTNGLGVAGFVTGLVGLVLFWIPVLGLLLSGCGVVLSAIGMSQGKKTGASTGLAIAGLVLGILGLIPALVVLIAFASYGSSF